MEGETKERRELERRTKKTNERKNRPVCGVVL
jgi:hypothetical protein